jgi:hypothetical protein
VKRAWLIATTLALAGCGSGRHGTHPSPLAVAQQTHEYPSPKPPPETASSGAVSAEAAIRAFATAYINWSADSVATDMRSLAAQSVGQARSAMELAAAQTAADYELQQGGISNGGTVEAVAPLAAAADEYVVVTRESTTATNTTAYDGLKPAWHVTIATVSRLGQNGWVVSGWQPEV